MAYYAEITNLADASAGQVRVSVAIKDTANAEFLTTTDRTFLCPTGTRQEIATIIGDRLLAEFRPIVDAMNAIATHGTQVRAMLIGRRYPAA